MSGEVLALRVLDFKPVLREVARVPGAPGASAAPLGKTADESEVAMTRAFADFSASAEKLHDSFASLKAEVKSLAAELEEKNRIIEALERQAARNERIAAMGEMAQRIAHQIRNPLGTIELYASMLAQDLVNHPSRALAERIGTAVRASDLVVDNLLAFADDMDPVRAPLCLHDTLREVGEVAERLVGARGVKVDLRLCANRTFVLADYDLVRQAILNLVTNAAQAAGEGAAITIATHNREIGFPPADEGGKPPAEQAWISVSVIDHGPGIEGGDLERVFDPLYSTRRGQAGIGLAIVQRVAETHGGLVEVESTPGEGATFRFSLPLHKGEQA